MAPLLILLDPPLEQDRVRLGSLRDRPIKLWRPVVAPSFPDPLSRVRIKHAVLVHPLDLRRVARTPDSERTDPEFHVRFGFLDTLVEPLYKCIDVVAAPILAGQGTFARVGEILFVTCAVWKFDRIAGG